MVTADDRARGALGAGSFGLAVALLSALLAGASDSTRFRISAPSRLAVEQCNFAGAAAATGVQILRR